MKAVKAAPRAAKSAPRRINGMIAELDPDGVLLDVVDGVAVIRQERLLSPLSKVRGFPVPFTGFRILTLDDERVVWVCTDCHEVRDDSPSMRAHRTEVHGPGLRDERWLVSNVLDLTLRDVTAMAQRLSLFDAALETAAAVAEEQEEELQALRSWKRGILKALEKVGLELKPVPETRAEAAEAEGRNDG